MTDKMREAFEKWYMTNTFAHIDHLSVFYNDLNCYPTPIANHCWKAWQAAQAEQSVPVEGEVVYIRKDKLQRVQQFGPSLCEIYTTPAKAGLVPLIVQPTHSITAAELERLRKDAERLRDALRYYGTHSNACDMSRFVIPAGCTCGYDAAIAAEGEKE